jgi:signal transduction histidine kinase
VEFVACMMSSRGIVGAMLHEFLDVNRDELVARCRSKSALRPSPRLTASDLQDGVPVLIGQLIDLLRSPQRRGQIEAATLPVSIGLAAEKHGGALLRRGFSVGEVVHDYGDLCQALTELALEKDEPISVAEFHTFNRCLDSAIADAVDEFGRRRDETVSRKGVQTLNERLGELVHEQRNLLNTAMLAFASIKSGRVAVTGATASIVDRSLDGLRDLIDRALADVRLISGLHARMTLTPIDVILEEVTVAAQLETTARGIVFSVVIEPALSVQVDRQMLSSAIANLLQNAFKFTRSGGRISLTARVVAKHVLIEVADECGGLPSGQAEELFRPFEQRSGDRSGLGLGLSISRRAVEANGGTLSVRDVPGTGCVFTIELPRGHS